MTNNCKVFEVAQHYLQLRRTISLVNYIFVVFHFFELLRRSYYL